jgi:hypothetical protein
MTNSRFFVPLLGAAAFIYALGSHSLASETQDKPKGKGRSVTSETLSPALAVAVNGRDDVKIALHVVNNAARTIEVRFPDARTHDFAILDSAGTEVWRWSRGRLFTQSLQNRVLESRETMTFDTNWRPAHAGRYTAVATLASVNHPLRARADFHIR